MVEGLNRETLNRLYIKEHKTIREIARMFGCSRTIIHNNCRKYGIKLRPKGGRIECLDKSVLQRLYVKEGKSTKKIAKMFSCSSSTVRNRCVQYGIKLGRLEGLNRALLQRLYVKEDKSSREIAKILNCSSQTIRNRCRQFGIKLKPLGRTKGRDVNARR